MTLPYTFAEQRSTFASLFPLMARYWSECDLERSQPDSLLERIHGIGHSMLGQIDGNSLNICALALASRYNPECRDAPGFEAGLAEKTRGGSAHAARIAMADCRQAAFLDGWVPQDGEHFGEDLLLGSMRLAASYWDRQASLGLATREEAFHGFAISIACAIEGFGDQLGFATRSCPADEDKRYHIDKGERWHPPLGADDPVRLHDCAGSLRYAWSRRWGADSDMSKALIQRRAAFEEARTLSESTPRSTRKPKATI